MKNTKYFLKSNIQIEPLVNLWHAYSFLIPPHTAAMVTKNYQFSIMKSYLKMPMAHVAALKDPDMSGGPFMDLGGKRLQDVKKLMEDIETNSADWLELAEGIKEMNKMLKEDANGYPMLPLYDKLPGSVKGFVELTYDHENWPRARWIEPLFYHSSYHNEKRQSIALTEITSDDRPFIFNTPRFPGDNVLHLDISFSNPRLDDLCKLKEEPKSLKEIKTLLQIDDGQEEILSTFLTEQGPAKKEKFKEEGVRVRFFGHACVLLESKDMTVLTDPLISYKYETDISRYTFEDLPRVIDYVVITHTHHDHIVLETLLQLRDKIKNVIVPKSGGGSLLDPSMKLILNSIGFENVIELDDMQSIRDNGIKITGIPFFGEHCDLDIRSKSVYHIELAGTTYLVAADSSNLNPAVYQNVRSMIGAVDVLFVGLECTGAPMSWTYGPLFCDTIENKLDQVRRSNGSNSQTAFEMAQVFNCKRAYLYAMGLEPWLNYFMALQHQHTESSDQEVRKMITKCEEVGIYAEKLFASKELILTKESISHIPENSFV